MGRWETRVIKISEFLSREERQHFRQASDAVAVLQIIINYAIIAGAFALFAVWPNPVTFIASCLLLAGRYVGLGILNHDAAHNALFATRGLNRPVAQWLFAGPTLIGYDTYRDGHLTHHSNAGTLEDPDITFVRSYPVEKDSMRRKLTRDLTGRTGVRDLLYLLMLSVKQRQWRALVMHGLLFTILAVAGAPWAYPLWWAAVIFVVPVCLRIRVMGEHGNVPNLLSRDARDHARTVRASWLARTLIAPNYVNYHCEHHFFANVPGYKLPELHQLLKSRGFYDDHPGALAGNYIDVVRTCIGDRPDRPDFGDIGRGPASLSNMA